MSPPPSNLLTSLIRFSAVGLAAATLDLTLFAIFHGLFDVRPWLANTASYSFTTVFSFVLHRHWTFATRKPQAGVSHQFPRFAGVNTGGLVLSTLIVHYGSASLTPIGAKVVSLPVALAWNYTFSRLMVFVSRTR